MASDPFIDAREAFIAACLTLTLGYGHTDKARVVLEDVLPKLGTRLNEREDRLRDIAWRWLGANNQHDRACARDDLRLIAQEMFLHRAVNAHDRLRQAATA